MENQADNNDLKYINPKPGYASSMENATRQFRVFWSILLLVAIVNVVVSYVFEIPTYLGIFNPNYSSQIPGTNLFPNYTLSGWYALYEIIVMIITAILTYGYILVTLKAARSEKPSIIDLFRPFKKFFTVVFSSILLALIIGVGFILLIIPGIFFLCRLAFVPYLIVDQSKGVFGAIGGSWKMTRGNFWNIFLIGLTIFGISMILLIVDFILMSIISGGNIFSGYTSNTWIFQIVSAVLSLPVGIFTLLIFGSLYNAIRLEKDNNKQASHDDTTISFNVS